MNVLQAAILSVFPYGREIVAREVRHQQEVLQVMCMLPGKHRYSSVEAAINASGVSANDIYMCLAAGNTTFALLRFYEALNGASQNGGAA